MSGAGAGRVSQEGTLSADLAPRVAEAEETDRSLEPLQGSGLEVGFSQRAREHKDKHKLRWTRYC